MSSFRRFACFALFTVTGCAASGSPDSAGTISRPDLALVYDNADTPVDPQAGDGGTPDDRLWPLELGRTWNFEVVSDPLGTCGPGLQSTQVFHANPGDTFVDYQVYYHCTSTPWLFEQDSSGAVLFMLGSTPATFLDAPPAAGKSWTYFGNPVAWSSVGTVSVPAGTFPRCWRAAQSKDTFSVWCPGVGPVWEKQAGGWEVKLSSKNF